VKALVAVKNVFQSLFQNRLAPPACAPGLRPRLAPPACAPGLRLPEYYVSLSGQRERCRKGGIREVTEAQWSWRNGEGRKSCS
jgi:hypothetical protein